MVVRNRVRSADGDDAMVGAAGAGTAATDSDWACRMDSRDSCQVQVRVRA